MQIYKSFFSSTIFTNRFTMYILELNRPPLFRFESVFSSHVCVNASRSYPPLVVRYVIDSAYLVIIFAVGHQSVQQHHGDCRVHVLYSGAWYRGVIRENVMWLVDLCARSRNFRPRDNGGHDMFDDCVEHYIGVLVRHLPLGAGVHGFVVVR